MLPLDWLRPTLPSSLPQNSKETILPSFGELQQKTKATLYFREDGNYSHSLEATKAPAAIADKSPKGSVDEPIQNLVDLINHHFGICTLSSCSGRISLFDHNSSNNNQPSHPLDTSEEASTPSPFTEASGKGRGRWVLVTHHLLLNPEELVNAVSSIVEDQSTSADRSEINATTQQRENTDKNLLQPWILKFEPMLLHVAARSLAIGQALLQLALECGFRESGLVVTAKRVTVAIRSHSLSLAVPLMPQQQQQHHPLCLPQEYLRALAQTCNSRLEANWKHMQRLYNALESKWFQIAFSELPIRIHIHPSPLPPLRLWNAATVLFSKQDPSNHPTDNDKCGTNDEVSIYVLGGYGKRPQIEPQSSPCSPSTTSMEPNMASQRSSSIYKLRRHSNGLWSRHWELVNLSVTTTIPITTNVNSCWNGLAPSTISPIHTIPACQGVAGARLGDWIVFWGGRGSPTKPLDPNQLWVFHPTTQAMLTVKVTETSSPSSTPCGRWGHCLVPLSHERLVMFGGVTSSIVPVDNENMAANTEPLKDIFILHYIRSEGIFKWEKLQNMELTGGRVHATATVVSGKDSSNDCTVPFGSNVSRSTSNHRESHDNESSSTTASMDSSFDTLLIHGGQSQKAYQNPLASFVSSPSAPADRDDCSSWACQIGDTHVDTNGALNTACRRVETKTSGPDHLRHPPSWFAGSCCSLYGGKLLISAGGCYPQPSSIHDTKTESTTTGYGSLQVHAVQFSQHEFAPSNAAVSLTACPWTIFAKEPIATDSTAINNSASTVDFGSMVHHACVPLSDTEFALIGGGASSFAFGDIFAPSYHVSIDVPTVATPNKYKATASIQNHDSTVPSTTTPSTTNSNSKTTINIQNSNTTATTTTTQDGQWTHVLYVHPSNAKRVKMELSSRQWLDKNYRMAPVMTLMRNVQDTAVDQNNHDNPNHHKNIAIPIVETAWIEFQKTTTIGIKDESSSSSTSWESCILGVGQEEMPFSTAKFAAKGKQ